MVALEINLIVLKVIKSQIYKVLNSKTLFKIFIWGFLPGKKKTIIKIKSNAKRNIILFLDCFKYWIQIIF
jgi:hypothetical protein